MQRLLHSEIGRFAFSFRDYIRAKYGVELYLEQSEQGDSLYLEEDNVYFETILKERDQFLQDPFNPRYEQASWQVGDIGGQKSAVKIKRDFSVIAQYFPPFTLFITILCVVIYLLGFVIGDNVIFMAMHYPADITQYWQLWRYISHSLVHLSLPHLLLNLTFWVYLGSVIEHNLGWFKLCLLYLFTAFITGIAQNWISGPAFFGLSGVVYGIIGYAFILERGNARHWFNLPSGFGLMIVVGILSGFAAPLIGVNVGNTAHISGLLVGAFVGGLTLVYQRRKTTSNL